MSRMAKQTFKICANVNFMMQEEDCLIKKYCEAVRLGFAGVETAVPYKVPAQELEKTREECGLTQVLINTPVGDPKEGEIGYASLPGREEKFMEILKSAIDYATTLKCKMIHIMAGLVTVHPTEAHEATYLANLKKAAPLLEKAGIVGVIEPINKYSVPKYFLSDYDKAISVIDAVGSENLGLLLDVFHLQQIKGNVTRNINQYLPYVKHVQVAQVPDRHEPDTPGELNYRYVFSQLTNVNYSGWVGLEYHPAGTTEEGLKWLKECGVQL